MKQSASNPNYIPGDEFNWNGIQCVVVRAYEHSILCYRKNELTGKFGVPVSQVPCKVCKGMGIISTIEQTIVHCFECIGTGNYQQVISNFNHQKYDSENQIGH